MKETILLLFGCVLSLTGICTSIMGVIDLSILLTRMGIYELMIGVLMIIWVISE